MTRGKAKQRTISGLILPVEWDESDKVVGVVIETADEESFIVDPDTKGRELLKFMHHKVEVTGRVRPGEYGDMHIKIIKCVRIDQKKADDTA
ncbi:MAG: hypothetical protein PHS17_18745 [Desulfobacterales bacterium]|nr:hypothetical protein [Desulfobacterales bacterium]